MANDTIVAQLKTTIAGVLTFQTKSLISRPEWGSIKFDAATKNFERIFGVLNHLNILPVELLSDTIVEAIKQRIEDVGRIFRQIDTFNIEQANAAQIRNNLVGEVNNTADSLYQVAAQWIPFLAYQKGDVSKNIEALTRSVTEAQALVEDAKTKITVKASEIETIISKAREASAAAGAAVFTKDFLDEAGILRTQADKWLKATGLFTIVTLVLACAMWYFAEPGLDQGQLIQRFGTKLAALILLFTATLWCGKIYRALMHQAAQHKHRALGLKTFQAFSHAASDNQTKDAVLTETTRSIFANTQTGYIDQGATDSDIKIVEVVRSILAKGEK